MGSQAFHNYKTRQDQIDERLDREFIANLKMKKVIPTHLERADKLSPAVSSNTKS